MRSDFQTLFDHSLPRETYFTSQSRVTHNFIMLIKQYSTCDILLFSLQVFLSRLLFNAGFHDSLMGLTHSSKNPDMKTK